MLSHAVHLSCTACESMLCIGNDSWPTWAARGRSLLAGGGRRLAAAAAAGGTAARRCVLGIALVDVSLQRLVPGAAQRLLQRPARDS